MAAKNKTSETNVNIQDFLNSFVEKEQKRQESYQLIELMREWSGFEPKMWGPSIIGFGSYHYKYASGHEGDAPLIAFSPRKAEFSLYVIDPEEDYEELLGRLGKFRKSKACIYFKRLEELDLKTLEDICRTSIKQTVKKHS